MARGASSDAAVPVEVTSVARRPIARFIETNGALEAENEVDIVARVSAPIVALQVEEGQRVRKGQLLAKLDDRELQARADISRVTLGESQVAYARAQELQKESLISAETFEQARATFESAEAQLANDQIQLDYTEIRAPFTGWIVERYVDLAQQVSPGEALFRISDFDPLLVPIQIPERELARLKVDQPAYVTVEAFPDARFAASVLRMSPVVDASTGTIKVTLAVDADERLRPGMFADVYVETDRRDGALVIPKAALALDSMDDAVYVAGDGVAERRVVKLGFQEGDRVEVLEGLRPDERVIVVGQDALSDGTPIQVLRGDGQAVASSEAPQPPRSKGKGRGLDGELTEERLAGMRERMKQRGMTEAQIDERIEQIKSKFGGTRPQGATATN